MHMANRLLDQGPEAAAFEVSERARARSLLESLKETSVNIREGTDASLLRRERLLEQHLDIKAEHYQQLLAERKNEEAKTLARDVNHLTTEYNEVQARIESESPRFAALMHPKTLSLAEVQRQVLDDDSVLLEYMLGFTLGWH